VDPATAAPDEIDREVEALTRPAAAVFFQDVEPVLRPRLAALLGAEQPPRPPVSRADFKASKEKWTAFQADAAKAREEDEKGEESPRPVDPDPGTRLRDSVTPKPQAAAGGHAGQADPGADGEQCPRDEAGLCDVALWKSRRFPPAALPPVWPSRDLPYPLTSPWTSRFRAEEGQTIKVTVQDVKPALGYLWPDPVVWLIRLDRVRDPESGDTVAISDDQAPDGLPRIEHVADRTGDWRVILAPYAADASGLADVTVEVAGLVVAQAASAPFGGLPLAVNQLSPGDLIFAGGDPQAPSRGHDATLALLPAPWAACEGRYAASNNDLGTLPLIEVGEGPSGSDHACHAEAPSGPDEIPDPGRRSRAALPQVLLVGSFSPRADTAVRVFVSRIGAREGGSPDPDSDLLSSEVEEVLRTCRAGQPPAGSCSAPSPAPAGWTAADTDHDGFTDFEEVFGIRRCYGTAPSPSFRNSRPCLRGAGENGRCLRVCPAETALAAELPLSAMDGPEPTVFDVFVEYDYWQLPGEPAGAHAIPADQVPLVQRAFEKEYNHATGIAGGSWFQSPPYPVRFHLFQDEAVPMPEMAGTAHLPSHPNRSLFFDGYFSPNRKLTNSFHYVLGVLRGGGQTDLRGRSAIIGVSGGKSTSIKLIHEVGHLLGLLHNGERGNPDHAPFYLSVMSYGFTHSLPPPISWDGSFAACGPNSTCPDHFRCVEVRGSGRLCTPDCGISEGDAQKATHFGRLSAGELVLAETATESGTIPETGYPQWYLPYLYCYSDASKHLTIEERVRRFLDPVCDRGRCVACEQSICRIDWNKDGRFEGSRDTDVDRDGTLNRNPLSDSNDLRKIMEWGKKGLAVLAKKTVIPFYTGFKGNSARNVVPYPSIVHERHGGYVTDVTNRCDEAGKWARCEKQNRGEAALFRGPASGDGGIEVRFPREFCLEPNQGVGLSLRVKPLNIPEDGQPVVLLDSDSVRLLLAGEDGQARWIAEIFGSAGKPRKIELKDPGALGRWTRLKLQVDNHSSLAGLTAHRGTTVLSKETKDAAVGRGLCSLTIGAPAGADSSFAGFLDDPMLLTGPAKGL
jgi:hypothetical protein